MHRFLNESDSCVVDQARGALMLRYGIGSRESLAVLDRWSQEVGVDLPEVAAALVHGICLGRVTDETAVIVRWLEQRMREDVGEERGTTEGSASGAGAAGTHVPAPAPAVSATVPAPRQWRYSSAVHAARVLRSR